MKNKPASKNRNPAQKVAAKRPNGGAQRAARDNRKVPKKAK